MTGLPLPFDQYPPHIVQAVAAYSAQKEIRSLIATSRVLRQFADMYLEERRITADPVLVPNIFVPIDERLVRRRRRRASLKRASSLFASHLAAYPLSSSSIRQLTVEVSNEDTVSGWGHIRRFANQLETLELHILDYRHDRPALETYKSVECCWPGHYKGQYYCNGVSRFSNIPFSNLTSLTLASTAYVDKYIQAMMPYLPNLRELILSCHWRPIDISTAGSNNNLYGYRRYEMASKTLDRLVISGHAWMVTNLLAELPLYLDSIRSLTICISDWTDSQAANKLYLDDLGDAVAGMSKHPEFTGLALYGLGVDAYLQAICYFQDYRDFDPINGLRHIATLIVEQTDYETDGDRRYPILSDWAQQTNRPILPALHSLTFVLDQTDGSPTDTEVSYDLDELRYLFAHYPSLHLVIWVSAYPILGDYNPSSFDSPFTFPTLLCSVTRVDSGKDRTEFDHVQLVESNYSPADSDGSDDDEE